MSHLDPKRPTTPTELRKFGLLVGGAFVVLSGVLYWRHKPMGLIGTFAVVGSLLLLFGLVAPKALGGVYAGWMRFALVLSKITTPIFMGIVYFVVITPTGLIMRLVGKRPLGAPRGKTAWVTREPAERRSVLSRQF